MLENSPDNFDTLDLAGLKPRMRTYHMRIKQKKMDLEDYDLSTSIFIQRRPSVKVASVKLKKECTN